MNAIVVDTSALIAILEDEADAGELRTALERASARWVSAPTRFEADVVVALASPG